MGDSNHRSVHIQGPGIGCAVKAIANYSQRRPPFHEFLPFHTLSCLSPNFNRLWNVRVPQVCRRALSSFFTAYRPPNKSSDRVHRPLTNPSTAMDLVLEGFDTFLFDPIYASLFPAAPSHAAYNAMAGNGSATVSSMREAATPFLNNWSYKPSSQYLSFTPSKWAYQSSLQRDNEWRQLTSLFLITWCGLLGDGDIRTSS